VLALGCDICNKAVGGVQPSPRNSAGWWQGTHWPPGCMLTRTPAGATTFTAGAGVCGWGAEGPGEEGGGLLPL
jgi:hypothetical protein